MISAGTAALILTGYFLAAGVAALSSAALLVIADLRGRASAGDSEHARARRFRFGWRLSSAFFDASILVPLAWTARVAAPRVMVIALVGLGASYLVSYQLARGQGLGYTGWESAPYRIATAALLVIAVLGGSFEEAFLEVPLWVFGAVTTAAALRRTWDVKNQDREAVATGRPA